MSNRQFVIVVIITFIVIVIWIISDILHTKPSIEVNPKLNTLLTPINPNFDSKIISQIKEITPIGDLEPKLPNPSTSTASSSAQVDISSNQTPLALPSAIVASLSALPGGSR